MNPGEYRKMRDLEDHYWWFVSRRELALSLLDHHVGDQPLILDVGCGTGAVLTELGRRGTAVGVDLSHDALSFSKSRGLALLVYANAEQLPFADATFDAVVSLDTIEHVPGHEAAAAEVFRVLKPGGVFVMNVPAFAWLWGPHDIALMHQRRYTRAMVRGLLADSGFTILKLSYSVFLLFPAVVARRLAEKMQGGEPKVKLPRFSPFWNRLLLAVMRLEAALFRRMDLPWGSSVVCVAQKPHSE
ncbi:MAG: methyltransferase domain-containing protein [Armatimonadetes bacterium]|nr:methyltransferase domain-containing protein [Armatimonadota bacterium]MBX3108096.1 methyltransferase domain-containing protein [Fimbriimonadaceae bacterium]